MCYHYKLTIEAKELENRLHAVMEERHSEKDIYANGFTHLKMPVITNKEPNKIQMFKWGLIPKWVKSEVQAKEMSNRLLNAKIETVNTISAFKDSALHYRCVVPATSFIEWQWLDEKGKQKQKYEISLMDDSLFVFGGIWSEWENDHTFELEETFSIVTTAANTLMSEIHNHAKRMPVILNIEQIHDWLNNPIDPVHFTALAQGQELVAIKAN